ncbi:MAG TPA: uroporphyrinogen-III C-methyltransferase [Burkholderiales bacterium]|nr:uroporphyrinogen-III C-methyltransferase [Burkholderiales bacterium]
MFLFLALAAVALALSAMLWQKLSTIQEQLARQSQEAGGNAIEARALARQAQEVARETAARQALTDTRLGEVALQRTQVEELIQSLSRSRDENLVVDIESALRLAQQQAQLTGSAEPLLAELRSADKRLERAAQPRLQRVRAAVARDIDRIRAASVTDVPGLLVKLDELARSVDELPLANAVANAGAPATPRKQNAPARVQWWEGVLADIREEARSLVRVSRVDQPEAVLLAPEQAFFLRENLKFKLLNARLGLLARQTDSARTDIAAAMMALRKYFDPAARRTQVAAALLQQVQGQLRTVELPRIDETLAVLATAAAGR